MKPTRAIIDVASLLEEGITSFQSSRHNINPEWSLYYSHVEALTLFNIVIRNIGGVAALAKTDLFFLPPAYVASRAALETSIKIMWLLKPENVFDREARYLAHMASEEEFYRRTGELIKKSQPDSDQPDPAEWEKAASEIRNFIRSVECALPHPAKPLKAMPSFRAMLVDLDLEYIYEEYIYLSQFSHGTHRCRELYRKEESGKQTIADYVSPELWSRPLMCAWKSLYVCGSMILEKLGGDLLPMNLMCDRGGMFEDRVHARSQAVFEYFGLPFEPGPQTVKRF